MLQYPNKFFGKVLDFSLPRLCLVCGEIIETDFSFEFICKNCFYNLPEAPISAMIIDRLLREFDSDEVYISEAYGLYSLKENNFLDLIHYFKYEGFYRVGIEFGRELGKKIKRQNSGYYDGVIPVPIHRAKERERGYNQSEYIATGISEITNWPRNTKLIKRSKYTVSQTKLNSSERKKNVSGIFEFIPTDKIIEDKVFLLVDDVFTTGSTINYLAKTLLENGARKVDCAAIGIA